MGFGTSANGGLLPPAADTTLLASRRAPRRPSRRSWSTVPTRTAICSWSYAATSVVTARPASADRTGTSSSTREGSERSSISVRPATRRVLWSPSEQSPRRSRLVPGVALPTSHEVPPWGVLHFSTHRMCVPKVCLAVLVIWRVTLGRGISARRIALSLLVPSAY
jgi:hypothetical protein